MQRVRSRPLARPRRESAGGWRALRFALLLPALELVLVSVLLGIGLAGIPLAMLGGFKLVTLIPAAAVIAAIACWLGRGTLAAARPAIGRWPLLVIATFVVLWAGFNARYASQNVIAQEDPSVYAVAGKWLAQTGGLSADGSVTLFGGGPELRGDSIGFYADVFGETTLRPVFQSGLPTFLAAGGLVGGDFLSFKTNVLLGAVALLLFFGLATRIVGAWPAVFATVLLGITLPQIYFARDTFSEVLTQALFVGGSGMLMHALRDASARTAILAGACYGLACAVRIDAFLWLIPITAYAFARLALTFGATAPERSRTRRLLLGLLAGLVPGVALGLTDLFLFGTNYWHAHEPQLKSIGAALVLVLVAGGAALALARAGIRPWRRLRSHTATLATTAGLVVLLLGLYALLIRPHVEYATRDWPEGMRSAIGNYQRLNGLPVDGARTYAEDTLRWLTWYLGWPIMLAAIVGIAVVTRDAVLGRVRLLLPALLIAATETLLYVARPEGTPIQLWITRRMLPVVIPTLVLAAVWIGGRFWRARGGAFRPVVALAAIAALVFPVARTWPLARQQTYVPLAYDFENICKRLPPHSALYVVGNLALSLQVTMTLRSFCDVPAAWLHDKAPQQSVLAVADTLKRRGYTPVVVSPEPLALPGGTLLQTVALRYGRLEQTIERPPKRLTPLAVTMAFTIIR